MSAYTDRCEAVTAALQNLARDLEADLGKITRWRGTTDGSTSRLSHFRDPGPDLATFNRQLVENTRPVSELLASYATTAAESKGMVYTGATTGPELTARGAVYDLADAIAAVTNHQEAADLVASFN